MQNEFIDKLDLPEAYGVTRLVLLARDPYWIHAYWEIAPDSLVPVQFQTGNDFPRSAYVLRIYDVTQIDFKGANAKRWFDIEVGPEARSWYVNIWSDNASYCADLGLRTPEGRFILIARSNTVATPRKEAGSSQDTRWMEVRDHGQSAVVPEPAPAAPAPSETWLAPAAFTPAPEPAAAALAPQRQFPVTEDEVRTYYRRLFPLLRRAKYRKSPAAKGLAEGLDNEKANELSAAMLLSYRKGQVGASEEMAGGASEKAGEKKRQFFFEIGTEMVVYGRTEPDASVFLGDKPVKLRPDGTFSLRFALPEGKIPLDFMARSGDQAEKRHISSGVERTPTQHNP
jgi:hypothetical protein